MLLCLPVATCYALYLLHYMVPFTSCPSRDHQSHDLDLVLTILLWIHPLLAISGSYMVILCKQPFPCPHLAPFLDPCFGHHLTPDMTPILAEFGSILNGDRLNSTSDHVVPLLVSVLDLILEMSIEGLWSQPLSASHKCPIIRGLSDLATHLDPPEFMVNSTTRARGYI